MKKKILSFVLTGAMLLSALPATFFASADAVVHDHDHDVATIAEGKCPGTGKPHSKEILGNDESKYTFVEHIDGDPHDCTVAEYTVYQCNECKDYFADDYSARVSHSFKKIPGTAKTPTCKAEGKEADLQCEICGYVQTGKKLDKTKDHKWKVIPGKTDSEGWMDNPDTGNVCTQGRKMRECEICGEIDYENDGHHWQFKSVKTEPTHGGADGVAIYECNTCHETKEVAIKATPHTWASSNKDGWELSEEGNCTTPDTLQRKCTACGYTETKQGDVRHNWSKDHTITVEPTCFTFGYTTRFCDRCGKVEQTNVKDKLKHDEKPTTEEGKKASNYKESTCNAPESWICSKCKQAVTGAPKLGHDVETVRLPAYCGRKSLTFSYCKRDKKLCNEGTTTTIDEEILNNSKINTNIGNTEAKLFQDKDFEEWEGVRVIKGSAKFEGDYNASNHLWDTAYIEVKATCTQAGKEVVYCRFCSQFSTRTVDKLPHTWELENNKPKEYPTKTTCVSDGTLEYHCTECDKYYVQETYSKNDVIKESYPSYDAAKAVHVNLTKDVSEIRPATCEVLGLSKAHCPDCGKDILFTIKKDHTNDGVFDATKGEKERVEATCTTDGSEAKFVCVDCGKLVGGEKIPAFGHNYQKVEGWNKVDPTCTTPGQAEKWVCEHCGKTDTDPNHDGHPIPKLGHDFRKVEDKKDATCTEDGHAEKWVCARPNCPGDDTNKPAVDPKTEHDGHKIVKTGHKWEKLEYSNTTDCTAPAKIILRYCTNKNCGVEYVANEDYTAASKQAHKFPEWSNDELKAGCEDKTVGHQCTNPGCQVTEERVIPGTGHHNKYNELILTDCKDKEAADKQNKKEDGRKCVDCDAILDVPKHEFKYSTTIKPTCVDDGGKVYICSVCHASEVREKKEATGHSWKNDPDMGWETVTEPTYASKGQEKRVCGNGCGTVEYRDIPVLGTEDPKNLQPGLQITLSADNADVPGAGYTDSSLIAVKVSLASYLGVDVWGVNFKLNYSTDYMEFVSGKIVSTTFLSNQRVTAVTKTVDKEVVPAGYVNVNANVPATQNTKVQASEDFAILYFRVKDTTREARLETFVGPNRDLTFSTDFTVEVVKVINNNSVNITTGVTKAEVTVRPFLDWNCDGSIDIADLLDLTKMITWESEVIYDVSFDVNKNGEIDIDDMMTLLDVISETISYAQAYAQAAQ